VGHTYVKYTGVHEVQGFRTFKRFKRFKKVLEVLRFRRVLEFSWVLERARRSLTETMVHLCAPRDP